MTTNDKAQKEIEFRKAALNYHRFPKPGKVAVVPSKPVSDQRDLSLAYSPGVAYPCEEIKANPLAALDYTAKGNLVAVISNGTAVLGLGNIGALAGKPVMEGKGVLFKKFAGIDVFDIEVDEQDPQKFIEAVASLEPTFGGINLEDIKAPECFEIEAALKARMNIPVFHDDQHGTAIIVAAGIMNALKLVNKPIESVRLVCSGAGAAALACLNLLVSLGLKKENILVSDIDGIINTRRPEETLNQYNKVYQQETPHNTLADAICDADIFLGLSAPRVLKPEMVKTMAPNPIIFALANPEPEIRPELVLEVRPDAIMATGRSDYPNQINNVLCFPFLFRGALDCGATEINEAMKIACVNAIARLAQQSASINMPHSRKGMTAKFGKDSIIPKPFDSRLIIELPVAVAKAAMESGVAKRPIEDLNEYRQHLTSLVYRSSMIMKPLFDEAKHNYRTIAYVEGEDERVLRAAEIIFNEQLANPVLVGRAEVIQAKLADLSITLPTKVLGREDTISRTNRNYVQIIDYRDPPHLTECHQAYYAKMCRKGLTSDWAYHRLQMRPNVLSGMLLDQGFIDGIVAGTLGQYQNHLEHITDTVGLKDANQAPSAVSLLLSSEGPLFFTDTHVTVNPSAAQLADITLAATKIVERFGLTPSVGLISHSNFGSADTEFSRKMRETLAILQEKAPTLAVDGEMQPELALFKHHRDEYLPTNHLANNANLFVFNNIDSANVTYNFAKSITQSVVVAPILTGFTKPVQILTNIATVRRVVNITAICATE
ncbi:NADP-dependent malic enzyme [Wohlfahrtiimonas chitiniclastica]|uniref:NADP-dependent malic enzyme n=1 Tax=Wohlfahrtiimonas chitiniclastica TaxID=400946 RepID=UPI0007B41829|nr:NADP-dependent malic enzyme [Wohlfahrtiimonas chitiniclastica]KZS23860.1 hypothetical protein BMY_1730 [Wohlfahrtiimonas chitiniclastica]WHR56241.1 NADP-dependent malic enzyme [Wohlfahrtiimonas chitiniclastica]